MKDAGGEEARWKRLTAVYGLQNGATLPRGTPDLTQPVYQDDKLFYINEDESDLRGMKQGKKNNKDTLLSQAAT